MGLSGNGYQLVLVLHILAVIVGFGTVYLNPLYGLAAKRRQGAEGLAISEEMSNVAHVAEYLIYLVPILGIGLVLMSDDVWEFTDTWIWLSLLLYFIGLGLSHGILQRNAKRMIELQRELLAGPPPGAGAGGPPPQVAELERRGAQVGQVSMVLNLLVIVITYLMVFKPGA